jgi:hypothetical protein
MTWHTGWGLEEDKEIKTLKESLGKTTCHFIGDDLRPLYVDALIIYNATKSDAASISKLTSLHGMLMPLTYALEATLFKLADELNIRYEQRQTIGQVFSTQNILKLANKIDNGAQQRVIKEQLSNLSGFIQEYRNNPIHNGKDLAIENIRQLENKLGAIFDRVKSLIEALDKAGLIAVPPYNRPAIGSADNWG